MLKNAKTLYVTSVLTLCKDKKIISEPYALQPNCYLLKWKF